VQEKDIPAQTSLSSKYVPSDFLYSHADLLHIRGRIELGVVHGNQLPRIEKSCKVSEMHS
jgi:hypothetical protein